MKPKKEDLFFPPKKSKKVDDVALPQPSFRRERKKKKRLDEISVLTTLHKVNARAL